MLRYPDNAQVEYLASKKRMVTISDSVEMRTPADRVWQWLCDLPDHFVEWHPAHHSCRVLRGRLWEPATVVEFEEDLHGRRHRLRFEVDHVTPGREISYHSGRWLRGHFHVAPLNGRSRFTAELSFGPPGLGATLDRLLARLFRGRMAAAQQHQREEGSNLKRLLEHRTDAP